MTGQGRSAGGVGWFSVRGTTRAAWRLSSSSSHGVMDLVGCFRRRGGRSASPRPDGTDSRANSNLDVLVGESTGVVWAPVPRWVSVQPARVPVPASGPIPVLLPTHHPGRCWCLQSGPGPAQARPRTGPGVVIVGSGPRGQVRVRAASMGACTCPVVRASSRTSR